MVRIIGKLLLSLFLLVFAVSFVSAWVDCGQYCEMNGGTAAECISHPECVVTSETGAALVGVPAEDVWIDPMCSSSMSDFCCLEKMCWLFDNTGQTTCQVPVSLGF